MGLKLVIGSTFTRPALTVIFKLLITLLLASVLIWVTSCRTYRVEYAEAKITVYNGKVKVEPITNFKPMPDTTVKGYLIRKKY